MDVLFHAFASIVTGMRITIETGVKPGARWHSNLKLNPEMKTFSSKLVVGLLALAAAGTSLNASGIPEPALVLYGSVTNTTGPFLLTSGGVNWTVAGGGSSAAASATIASVNGQFFYVARIPFETRFAGNLTFSPATNTLPLTASPTIFTRSATVDGVAATSVPPAATNFTFSKADRGRIERVDLLVSLPLSPNQDSDGDGMSDYAESIAGTDPADPNSVFKASTDLQPASGGGLIIKWSSIAGKVYSIQRATNLAQGFSPLATNLTATAPENQFADSTATNTGPYFYRIQVNP
jgi:hypothetical protein